MTIQQAATKQGLLNVPASNRQLFIILSRHYL